MPALARSEYTARITWLGRVPDRDSGMRAEPLDRVPAQMEGFEGEAHGGLTRPSCSRFTMLYPRYTTVRNTRQISIVSAEELAEIAGKIGLDTLNPSLLGASMVVEGIPDFSHVPPGSRLRMPSGAVLTIDLENGPCVQPGREIEAEAPGHGKAFKPAAEGLRGVTAWVEREGELAVNDAVELFLPTQPAWAPMAVAAQ